MASKKKKKKKTKKYGKGKQVLIVHEKGEDYDEPINYYIRALGEEAGFTVNLCDVDTALSLARKDGDKISAIVMEIMIQPGMAYAENPAALEGQRTGLLLYPDLRELCPDIPIIVLTDVEWQPTIKMVKDLFQGNPKSRVLKKKGCCPFTLVEVLQEMLSTENAETES